MCGRVQSVLQKASVSATHQCNVRSCCWHCWRSSVPWSC